jgi:hypothetical protein
MNTGISLTALAQQIENEKAIKKDLIADTRTVHMSEDGSSLNVEGRGAFNLRNLAHAQIATRIGIPQKYYDRMRAEAPDLLSANVNRWFEQNPERRMIRTMGPDARAFLSDRYQRIDHSEIAEVALPIIAKVPQVKIVSCQITDMRMYIQAVAPLITGEVKKGDIVEAGVVISNSEVGAGSVSVATLAWRLICLNGMKMPDGNFKAYHVGRRIEDDSQLWQDDTRKADDRAVLLKVRDMVAAALDKARFEVALDKMRATTEAKITGNPALAVEELAKTIGASEAETGGILRALIEGGDLSAWGVINAVTAQAHTAKDYDRSVDFENAGGQLLELPRSDWKRILEAA